MIAALCEPGRYPHRCDSVTLVETHISWVLLAGEYAYKIKKPVNFSFVDFSTLERRARFCQEEIRLNRRLAPELYLDRVEITGTPTDPHWGPPVGRGQGPAMEYAVRMRRFADDQLLLKVLAQGGLKTSHVERLAIDVAAFHRGCSVATADSPFGSPEWIRGPVDENFQHFREVLDILPPDVRAAAEELRSWTVAEFAAQRETFVRRKAGGCIRECHGDMHLGNMILDNDRITVFDCVEFNDHFRWIDLLSEVAFLVMDLFDRRQPPLAHRFLSTYLEETGDYTGVGTLRYYLVYRALVRAKVAAIRFAQESPDSPDRPHQADECGSYIRLAGMYSRFHRPAVVITHGVSGSGKSTYAQALVDGCGMIRLRSDVERKRMHGLAAEDRSGIARGLYDPGVSDRVYDQLAGLADGIVAAGWPVVVDAAFLKQSQRKRFADVAERHAAPFLIASFHASEDELRSRVSQRAAAGTDASDADVSVLLDQLRNRERLTDEEQSASVSFLSPDRVPTTAVVQAVQHKLGW
jgi:aminoglycoside phosphotransferase family enzyme/predicted kinase